MILRLPGPFPRPRFPSPVVPHRTLHCSLLPPAGVPARGGPGDSCPAPRDGRVSSWWRSPGSRKFLKNPCPSMPRSSTPAGFCNAGLYASRVGAFRPLNNVGSRISAFEAQFRGLDDPCVRFITWITPSNATLGSDWWPAFIGQDWIPAGSLRKVSITFRFGCLCDIPLSQASCRPQCSRSLPE
jgi:hypothetical protein